VIQKFPILFSALFLLLFAGCGTGSATPSVDPSLAFEGKAFTIGIPTNWEVFPDTVLAGKGVDFGARDANGFGKIETVIAVTSEDIPNGAPLDRFTTQSLENIRRRSQNFQKQSEEPLNLDGVPATLVRYTDRNVVDLSQLQFSSIFAVHNGKAFVAVLSMDYAKTESEKTKLEEILKSFRIKGTSPSPSSS